MWEIINHHLDHQWISGGCCGIERASSLQWEGSWVHWPDSPLCPQPSALRSVTTDAASRPTPASASLAGAAWTAPVVSHTTAAIHYLSLFYCCWFFCFFVFFCSFLCHPAAAKVTSCSQLKPWRAVLFILRAFPSIESVLKYFVSIIVGYSCEEGKCKKSRRFEPYQKSEHNLSETILSWWFCKNEKL